MNTDIVIGNIECMHAWTVRYIEILDIIKSMNYLILLNQTCYTIAL